MTTVEWAILAVWLPCAVVGVLAIIKILRTY